ncbi:AAA domain-containing protein, putative AbiEii toxin, Type IV TA system [Flaviramulus basaltis]|uniref:AAA domain-containing protein, putative AbiEii toxin, Type IV TA system n=1 Tax=Flaviramulus basaltis TaxID=369401 RepID=A0A1K2IPY5_9FLAO|nr:AAA family ATPase [Flaviramulus basaltis]SFZ94447.1 AAA domain-containing protein, putative AbiEii toxin, Type IV TA system [Flaviramulus basaltis]
MKINKSLKLQILKEILKQSPPFYSSIGGDIMEFLEKIWELKAMPSTDERYKDAYGDIVQHIINNDDWTLEFLFIDRLELLEDDSKFIKFLNLMIHPDTRSDENSIMNYYYLIQPYLKKAELSYSLKQYADSGLPVYEVEKLKESSDSQFGIRENEIPFIVDLNPNGHAEHMSAHKQINEYPFFALAFNSGWNDFKVKSTFHLFYHRNQFEEFYIGEVKIIHLEDIDTSNKIPLQFTKLDSDFCSLGQSIQYYKRLREYFDRDFKNILWALRDSAFFVGIREEFEYISNFRNSLIRENQAERLLREAQYLVYNYDLENLYSFHYSFKSKFADNNLDVEFNFKDSVYAYDRIYSVIGKNGTGKTQLITSLPNDISRNKEELFTPKPPIFSKVIAVSYSTFDSFEIPNKSATFNYVYCGLKDKDNKILSEVELITRFHQTRLEIVKSGRVEQWVQILENFIDENSLSQFIIYEEEKEAFLPSERYRFDTESFNTVRGHLSSGQSIILFIVTEIVANIRFDSLIIYDEPETHLHPNAISQLINTIYELVHQFKSYCIIATHSPLIIQEILSKNVYVIEREGNYSSLRKIGLESFGENLSILTEEVFGNRSIPKQYKIILERLVKRGYNFEGIKQLLESDQIPLSLNAIVYLKSILNEKS